MTVSDHRLVRPFVDGSGAYLLLVIGAIGLVGTVVYSTVTQDYQMGVAVVAAVWTMLLIPAAVRWIGDGGGDQ